MDTKYLAEINKLLTKMRKYDRTICLHQERVANIAAMIAKEMQLPSHQCDIVFISALLHDTGKLKVPLEVLNFSGVFTEAHWAIMKKHPDYSRDLLKENQFIEPIPEIVRQHHERADGKGHPRGLKSKDILLEAKIVSVADSLDAMLHARPHQVKKTFEEAMGELEKEREAQFSGEVVDACFRLYDQLRDALIFNSTPALANSSPLGLHTLRSVLSNVKNGVVITDENGKILFSNKAISEITHYEEHELLGNNPGILHSGKHGKKFYELMWRSLLDEGQWQGEVWNRKKSGEIYPALLTISSVSFPNEESVFYVAISNDISFLEEDTMQQYDFAFYDPLTQLANRNLLEQTFKTLGKESLCLLFIDLDKFKTVNDSYGHVVGDQLLISVGEKIKSLVRKSDIAARFGGDEFVILLKEINTKKEADQFCQKLHGVFKEKCKINEICLEAHLSVGVSFYPLEAKDFNQLITQADSAMYFAKKNQLSTFFYSDMK